MNIHTHITKTIRGTVIFSITLTLLVSTGTHSAHAQRVPPAKSYRHHDLHHLHAPTLSPAYPSLLTWKWNYPNPYQWYIYISLDNGRTFQHISDYWAYGNARQFAPDGGSEYMFIVGVDSSGKEITKRSAVVRPDDAHK